MLTITPNRMELKRQYGKNSPYAEWDGIDILKWLEPMINGAGYYIDKADRKIKRLKPGVGWQTPWLHVKAAQDKRCNLDHHVLFNRCGIIPVRCQECWKIVVMPQSLKELFQLHDLETKLDLPSKCGIEIRDYTHRLYGGYFYCNSLDQGRERYKIVREAVSDAIGPHVNVILKRGCTEFEMERGPSVFWVVTPEALEIERRVEERVENMASFDVYQPDYINARVKKHWVHWAYCCGDPTYADYTGGETLYPPPVMYHEGDIDVLKADLAGARSNKLYGLDAETVDNFRKSVLDAVDVRFAGTMLGHADFNPLYIGGLDETT